MGVYRGHSPYAGDRSAEALTLAGIARKFHMVRTTLMQKRLYVQYGCGFSAPKSWRNFDASPTLYFERIPIVGRLYTKNQRRFPANVEFGDIVRGLPIPSSSCDGVYCSHVLEHLALEEFRIALRNTKTMLKPGATFRLVVPDLELAARRYLSDRSVEAAGNFMRETSLGRETRPRGLLGFVSSWLGLSSHLWMWDERALAAELDAAGFRQIRRAKFGDAEDAMFSQVEEEERWIDCLGMSCIRASAAP